MYDLNSQNIEDIEPVAAAAEPNDDDCSTPIPTR